MLGPPRYQLTTEDGSSYTLYVPAKSVGVGVVTGHGTAEIARAMIAQVNILFAQEGTLAVFADFSEMKSYTTETRVLLTDWTKTKLPKIRMLHLCVRSKIVAMGVSVANMALRSSIQMYTVRARFDAALQMEIDRVQGLKRPSIPPR